MDDVTRFYPGPECLVGPRDWEPLGHTLLLISPRVAHIAGAEFLPAAGIALAWVAVMARRERFRAWMEARPESLERTECLAAFAGTTQAAPLSPEAFARHLVDRGMLLCTLWLVHWVGGEWPRRAREASYARGYFTATKRVMDEMMGLGDFAKRGPSPEWAALPFNASGAP
jgi:hypothetical protein